MEASPRTRVLMIGMDAAEVSLVDAWRKEGFLPNLQKLRDQGTSASLRSSAEWLVGSPWPTFYTGTPPEEHGFYHYLMWRPEHMDTRRPTARRVPLTPFWRELANHDRRAIAIDAPITYAPQPFDGLEISGWGTHETLEKAASHPSDLIEGLRSSIGDPPFGEETSYFLAPAELLRVRDRCIRTTEMAAAVAVDLLRDNTWDFFLVCFSALHRAGHQLWSPTNQLGAADPETAAELRDALRSVYSACDAAVGRLLDLAGPDVATLVFSVHGMGPNTSRTDILQDMLSRILQDGRGNGRGLARRLRGLVPRRWRTRVKHSLPKSIQDRLTVFWRGAGTDWSSTRAFTVFGDLEGYIRVNLRGREAEGIVEPGTEYEALCQEIIEGLATFVDADTGEPVVSAVGRREDLYPEGAMSDHLPDLIVRWSSRPAAEHRSIVSEKYGTIAWPTPGLHPQARSGNHIPDGFLIAAGADIAQGVAIPDGHILDLAPTAFDLLGLDPPQRMKGRPLFRRDRR